MLFSGKIGYQIPPLRPLFATICPLFATIRRNSRLFATIRTIRDYSYYSHHSIFATIRYSGFPDNPFGNPACEFVLSVFSQLKRETLTILRQLPLLRDIKIY